MKYVNTHFCHIYELLEERGNSGETFALTDRGFEVADLLRGEGVLG
jgi:hypothetical protein